MKKRVEMASHPAEVPGLGPLPSLRVRMVSAMSEQRARTDSERIAELEGQVRALADALAMLAMGGVRARGETTSQRRATHVLVSKDAVVNRLMGAGLL
jgi:hypothetical protein